MIEIPQSEDRVKDEQIEGLGLELQEEPIAIMEPGQAYNDPIQEATNDKEALRRQKTHAILNDHQLKDLIGVRAKSSLDSLGLKSDTVELTLLGNLRVSLFWEEKIMALLHAMQLLGFYYVLYSEQVPDKYSYILNFFAAFIGKIDIIVFYSTFLSNYLTLFVYTLAWAGVCVGAFSLFFILYSSGYLQRASMTGPYALFKLGYYALEFLAFPFLMNTVPNAVCQFYTTRVEVEVVECWSQPWHLIVVIAAAFTGAIVVAIALAVWIVAYNNYVYDTNDNHENYLKMKEMEHVFDLSYMWRSNWFFLFSSFRREGFALYHRTIYYGFIIALTLLYTFLGKYPDTKFYVIALLVICFALYVTVKPPFRCGTTNIVYIVLMWGTFPTLIMLYLRTSDMRSALIMVDNNFGAFLISLNVFVVLLVLMLFGIFIALKVRWPVDPAMVEEVMTHPRFISMLGHLREAKVMSIDLAKKRRFYFVNKSQYLEILGYLEHDFTEADKMKHFFKDIILEFIEELSQYYPMVTSESLLPHPRLEGVIDLMRQVLLRRARDQILINPRRQKVLLHLLTFRMLYDQYWAGRETAEMLKKAIEPTKLTPLEEMKFQKGEGIIDQKHQNILDDEQY